MGYSTIDTFIVTAYLAIDEYENRFHGITYSGVPAKANHTVAVDPRVVPLGAWLYIEDLGWYRAEDTGNMIIGKRLDICVETRDEAMQWGKRKRQVWFLSPEQFAKINESDDMAEKSVAIASSG
jgi:3D (Asp-Asp-Asp) domain-containing protein